MKDKEVAETMSKSDKDPNENVSEPVGDEPPPEVDIAATKPATTTTSTSTNPPGTPGSPGNKHW